MRKRYIAEIENEFARLDYRIEKLEKENLALKYKHRDFLDKKILDLSLGNTFKEYTKHILGVLKMSDGATATSIKAYISKYNTDSLVNETMKILEENEVIYHEGRIWHINRR